MYFYGLWGRQTQGPPRAAHTLATPLHNVRITLQLAYHGCKNLTHTSKTRQVKRTQMVVTVGFTIRVFLTFSDW